MIRKMAFVLAATFFAVSFPLYSQQTAPAPEAPPEQAQPAEVQQPAPSGATFESAMRLYRRGRYSAAIDEFQQVVAADPNNAAAWYFMGYAHYVQRHLQEAQDAFAKAFAANPTFDPRPHFR